MMNSEAAKSWPVEIRLRRAERLLEVDFDDGETFRLSAEYLRVESPSAEVKGHGEVMPPVTGKEDVALVNAEPVGNYAVRLIFDDGHDTGLYTWDYLYRLGAEVSERWGAYIKRLADAGVPRKRK